MPSPGTLLLAVVLLAGPCALPPVAFAQRPAAISGSRPRVPPAGSDSQLDVASWNVEWFGAPRHGPRDEDRQLANVRDVVVGTDADLWGMAEIVDRAAWQRLLAAMPAYAGVLADDAIVRDGRRWYAAGEQKPAIVYKPAIATLLGARVILSHADAAFAGRPPLEARFRIAMNGATDELTVIVVHMKAFADARSRLRRESAGRELKAYLDGIHPVQKVLVIGDWNDDVDVSIVPRQATPYAAFVADSSRYRFVTRTLSAARISSMTRYRDPVDHHLATDEMAALAIPGSAKVHRVDAWISRYRATTSDHFPVLSHYRWRPR